MRNHQNTTNNSATLNQTTSFNNTPNNLRPDLWDERYSPKEIETLKVVATQYGLDPLTREVIMLNNNIYVTAAGLQKLALRDPDYDGCEIELIQTNWDSDFFVVKASIWKKGCTHPFEDYGDADPTTSNLRGHALFRHAITRARARAMRSAFAIPFCSLEELDDELRWRNLNANANARPEIAKRPRPMPQQNIQQNIIPPSISLQDHNSLPTPPNTHTTNTHPFPHKLITSEAVDQPAHKPAVLDKSDELPVLEAVSTECIDYIEPSPKMAETETTTPAQDTDIAVHIPVENAKPETETTADTQNTDTEAHTPAENAKPEITSDTQNTDTEAHTPAKSTAQSADTTTKTQIDLATTAQHKMLQRYLAQLQWTRSEIEEELRKHFGLAQLQEISREQASMLLDTLAEQLKRMTSSQHTKKSRKNKVNTHQESKIHNAPPVGVVSISEPNNENDAKNPVDTDGEQRQLAEDLLQRMAQAKSLDELRNEWQNFLGIRHKLSNNWNHQIREIKDQRKSVLSAA
jgi:hypothetical protein